MLLQRRCFGMLSTKWCINHGRSYRSLMCRPWGLCGQWCAPWKAVNDASTLSLYGLQLRRLLYLQRKLEQRSMHLERRWTSSFLVWTRTSALYCGTGRWLDASSRNSNKLVLCSPIRPAQHVLSSGESVDSNCIRSSHCESSMSSFVGGYALYS